MSDTKNDFNVYTGPVFVFGANQSGAHGAGSALAARKNYGAQLGVGNGITGQSYGIPTCAYNDKPPVITPLTPEEVVAFVNEFVEYAKAHPELIFMMTKIGTGIGGFSGDEICAMLAACPDNVDMPMDWNKRMGRKPVAFSRYEELYPCDAILMEKHHIKPTTHGFTLLARSSDTEPINFEWNTDRSRIQNVHEAIRFGMGFTNAKLKEYDPEQDGTTHINIYSKGHTEIGKFLSNFTAVPIETLDDGDFASIEGYWYWLTTDPDEPRRDELRRLSGFAAKKIGRELRAADWRKDAEFVKKITYAIEFKVTNNANVCGALLDTGDLPLVHYYDYNSKIVEPQDGKWVIDWMYVLRDRIRALS